MTTLYLIRGVPGSGKSTFAKELFDKGVVHANIEADMYFEGHWGEYRFDPSQLGDAHKWCQDRTCLYLKEGWSIAVSNTSTTEKEVKVYSDIAKQYGATFVSLVVENRHGGVNTHGVPPEKIEQMKNRFSIKL